MAGRLEGRLVNKWVGRLVGLKNRIFIEIRENKDDILIDKKEADILLEKHKENLLQKKPAKHLRESNLMDSISIYDLYDFRMVTDRPQLLIRTGL